MNDIPQKRCPTCPEENQWHPATPEYFYPRKGGKYDLYSRCKECCKSEKKAYYQKNAEQVRARVQTYREQNPEKVKECKEAYESRPEVQEQIRVYHKEYYSRPEVQERERLRKGNPEYLEQQRIRRNIKYHNDSEWRERRRAQSRAYHNRPEVRMYRRVSRKAYLQAYYNRPEIREHRRINGLLYRSSPEVRARIRDRARKQQHTPKYQTYRKSYLNRPEVRERNRAYQRLYSRTRYSHPVHGMKMRAKIATRNARRKLVQGAHTATQIAEQLKRQKYRCYYAACGHAKLERIRVNGMWQYKYHIEHTFPVSRVAGTDIPANDMGYIVLACPSCNLKKQDKFPWEWPEGGRLL